MDGAGREDGEGRGKASFGDGGAGADKEANGCVRQHSWNLDNASLRLPQGTPGQVLVCPVVQAAQTPAFGGLNWTHN